jgi:hypothetical protein
VDSFVAREVVDACISPNVFERAPLPGVHYIGFVDPSGGSSDSMTLAIVHKEGETAVVDAIRERKPPFSPEAVTKEFSDLLKSYRIAKVTGDRYAGLWPTERFFTHGIAYEPSELVKSDIYGSFLPLLNSCRVDLLDHKKLANQLVSLERRTARGGKDSIDHPPAQHDDIANAVAGAAVLAIGTSTYATDLLWVDGDTDPDSALRAHRRFELQQILFAR